MDKQDKVNPSQLYAVKNLQKLIARIASLEDEIREKDKTIASMERVIENQNGVPIETEDVLEWAEAVERLEGTDAQGSHFAQGLAAAIIEARDEMNAKQNGAPK